MTDTTGAATDPAAIRAWLAVLHGDSPGLVHICATGLWTGRAFDDLDHAADYAAELDHAGREGVYVRATTLRAPLAPGARGGEDDTLALPGLWADIDIAGPGHKTTQVLPPNEAAARRLVDEAGLPDPTVWVHSGGGLYPWWLLTAPHVVDGDLEDVKALSARWQQVLAAAAARLGWHYGAGVGDLARVLRVPGTVNRKDGLSRPCRIIDAQPGRYTLEQLHEALAGALEATTPPQPPAPALRPAGTSAGGVSPGDDYEAQTDWTQILVPAGWALVGQRGDTRYWRRPGKTGGVSATTGRSGDRDRLFVFTTSTCFDAWSPYTKFGAYALLEHAGDHKAAAQALKAAGFGQAPPLAGDRGEQENAALYALAGADPDTPVMRALRAVDGTAARVLEPATDATIYGPTEDGLARALVAAHGHTLRYCPQRGRWLVWDGHRWAWDEAERHRELVRALARDLPDEKEWRSFKRRAMSAAGVTGITRLAQTDQDVTVHLDALDARPYELNTPAGIVDLRTGQLRPPDPAALHTRCTTVAPDFDRRSEVFDAFLADTFGPDTDLAGYVQRLLGISAIGTVLEQLMPFAHGSGANGKSTLLEACMYALGTGERGYAMAAPAEMLMARRHSEHPAELAQLAGARLVVCSELDDGQRFAEARIKQLTGRDSINARFMRRDPFTFTPSHTLWLLGNHKPDAHTGGPAFWRRIRLLPFIRVVPEDRRDKRLGEKLAEDAAAVLAWMARGAADYHADGLREPASVLEATRAYQADQDTVARFVDECCHLAPGQTLVRAATAVVCRAYETWCSESGETPVSPKRLGTELRDRWGVTLGKSNGKKFYVGLALLDTGSDRTLDGDDDTVAADPGRYR